MTTDPWLDRWLPLVAERAHATRVLELGCGEGEDTATLVEAGLDVVGLDLSASAIEQARRRAPSATLHCQDLRAPFPLPDGSAGVVLASLCLHYFEWAETLELVARIHRVLARPGLLLSRFNSTHDHHHGASGHPRIADNYYLVDGQPKRFFDEASVQTLFARGWRVLSAQELVIRRYAQPKAVWEVAAEPVDEPAA